MPNPTTASSDLPTATRFLHIGNDVEIKLVSFVYYPMWFWVVIAAGFMFCTVSCAVWFFCAMYRLRKEKPCNHPVYEAKTIVNKDGEEKIDKAAAAKSEKHCKKVGALSEAESLAKSFKSVRSKKSTKSSRKSSKKSIKKSSKEQVDDNDDKPKTEENQDEKRDQDNGKSGKSKASRKSSRKDGGRDCVLDIEGEEAHQEESVFRKIANSFLIFRN
ncbi:unnamed protein product [Caenorhabditis brenneri]